MSDKPIARSKAPLRKKLLLAVASFFMTLALLEGCLWLLHPLPGAGERRLHRYLPTWTAMGPAPRTLRTNPGPLHGVTPGVVQSTLNSYGYLYPEQRHRRSSADELRVAVVGGSTVECGMLAPDKRWPAVLEDLLQQKLARPVTVLNLGVSAQGTRTHLATTSHIVTDLDVDACVYMIGANDLGTITSSNHPMLDSSAFYARQRPLRGLQRMLRVTQTSRHLRYFREQIAESHSEPYFAEEAALQASLPTRPDDVQATATGLAHYARNVTSLAGICKEHGIEVLFTTQPGMFPAEPTPEQLQVYWGCHTGSHSISPQNFMAMLATANAHLREICDARGYACVDLDREVPEGLEWFYDQVHFNEAGARRVAEALVAPLCVALE